MSLHKSRELRLRRGKLVSQMTDLITKAESQDRSINPEEQDQWDRMEKDCDALLQRAERIEEHESRLADVEVAVASAEPTKSEVTHRSAFSQWIRGGDESLSPEQRNVIGQENRALSVGTASAGGNLVPEDSELFSSIVEAQLAVDSLKEAGATVIVTNNGQDLPIPTGNDTGQSAVIISEGGSHLTSAEDPSFGQVTLGAYAYSSRIIRLSLQLLQDSSVPIESLVGKWLGTRLGRGTVTDFTVGDGSSKPTGLTSDSVLGVTAAGAAAITYGELVDLQHSVDRSYRSQGTWMAADATISALRQLLDGDSRPLWAAGLASGASDTLLGRPYVTNNDVQALSGNQACLFFGDFSAFYIREVKGIELVRFSELYMDALQVGLLAVLRTDGRLINAGGNPVKHLQTA